MRKYSGCPGYHLMREIGPCNEKLKHKVLSVTQHGKGRISVQANTLGSPQHKQIQWNLPLVRIRKFCHIKKKLNVYKTFICVQRLCRIEIIPDYTGVGLARFHCTCK